VIKLAVDIGDLVSQTETKSLNHGRPGVYPDQIRVPEFATLEELSQQAIQFGLESKPVEIYLQKMGFDTSKYEPVSPEFRGPPVIEKSLARKLRLEQASNLKQDIGRIAV
jgi:hypothetical protein